MPAFRRIEARAGAVFSLVAVVAVVGLLPGTLSAYHGIGGAYDMAVATFAPLPAGDPLTADMVLGDPQDGCQSFNNAGAIEGRFVLVASGSCDAPDKYQNAVDAGALGLVAYMAEAGPPVSMDGTVADPTIPAVTIERSTGLEIIDALGLGHTVRVSLVSAGDDGFYINSRPTIPGTLTAVDVGQTSLTLEWDAANDPDDDVVEYRAFRGDTPIGGPVPDTGALTYSLPVSDLAPGTQYSFTVVAIDAVGLESAPLGALLSTNDLVPPNWPPMAQLDAQNVTQNSLTLSWPPAEDGDSDDTIDHYRVSWTGLGTPVEVSGTETSYGVGGLTAGTNYTFTVVAVDADGLESLPLQRQFTTVSLTGPYWPSGAQLTFSNLTGTSVLVAWPAALDDDGTIASYQLYWNGNPYGLPTTQTSMTVTGNLLSTNHNFAVVATDNDGLVSPGLQGSVQGLIQSTAGAFDPTTGLWFLLNSQGSETNFYFGNPGDYPFMGDWNCDGIDTPGLYRQSDGFVYLRNTNDQGIAHITFFFGNPGDIPIAGDFNNDGCDTVSIYRPSNQTFYIINQLGQDDGGLGQAEFSYVFGNPGDKPFVGDFDGDGVDTVGLHRESTGLVYFRNSHTQGNADAQFFFGNPGDRLFAGDWGIVDGVDTPALFRPSNRTWYFRHTNTQGNADSQFFWGQSHWLPLSGRFGLG